MPTITSTEEQVLSSLNTFEARRHQTDAAFRSITELEVEARRKKTERLRAERIQLSQSAR
jgi:hypothetical protein